MALEAGTRLGHYEVVSSLGAGGMGEVYRAKDTKLGREVAIKLLLEEVSKDPERLARFEREARVLASLNHPNIATLHGFEKEVETSFLIMELVEGETLADRLARGPIPVQEALPLFLQIAKGLEAAHEKGVIHRDLKPANIKVSDNGEVKILDFGLAKAMAPAGVSETDPSESPTITAAGDDRTRQGQILGTAPYMSPEQTRGRPLDKRTDIWSFGCVAYESLAGRRPFSGQTTPDTMVGILEHEPDWDWIPTDVRAGLLRVIQRCLAKDPRQRLRDIGEVRIEIEESRAEDSGREGGRSQKVGLRSAVVIALTALLSGALGSWLFLDQGSDPGIPTPVRRTSINLPDDLPLRMPNKANTDRGAILSPDGQWLVYVAVDPETGLSQLAKRRMDSTEVEVIAGTPRPSHPFFSPDSRWVGFYSLGDGALMKVSVEGGILERIVGFDDYQFGLSWGEDGFIYFGGGAGVVKRIPETGGQAELVSQPDLDGGEEWHLYPEVLPGAQGVLILSGSGVGAGSRVQLQVLDLATRELRPLAEGSQGQYAASGHVLFGEAKRLGGGRRLVALPFDLQSLRGIGEPFVVAQPGMPSDPVVWDVDHRRSLIYVPEQPPAESSIAVVDRSGQERLLTGLTSVEGASISPDGKRLAAGVVSEGSCDIWLYDVDDLVPVRLTFSQAEETRSNYHSPIWTPDGTALIFVGTNVAAEGSRILRKAANGLGPIEVIVSCCSEVDRPGSVTPAGGASVTPDGRTLIFEAVVDGGTLNLWAVSLEDEGTPRPLLQRSFDVRQASVSPDSRWLAYRSDEAETSRIYVASYPSMSTVHQIGKGVSPAWNPEGGELFFLSPLGAASPGLFAITIGTEPQGVARQLFQRPYVSTSVLSEGQRVTVFPTGEHFLLPVAAAAPTEILVVENWFGELKRLVPSD